MAGVVLAVAAIAAVALWPESTAVDLAQAVRGPMEVTLDEDGETRVRERFVVSAPVAGRLQRIELEPGDAVVKGRTVVARLAPAAPPLLDPRARAEFDAAAAAASGRHGSGTSRTRPRAAVLERARAALRRQQALSEAGAVSRDDLESAQTAVKTAEEALRAATMGVARAEQEARLARARLQTPAAIGPRRGRRRSGKRHRPAAPARKRNGGAGRRRTGGAGRPQSARSGGRPAVHRRGAGQAGQPGPDRAVGRQPSAASQGPAHRAVGFRQSVGARRRGAAGQRDHRPRRSGGRRACARRRLPRRGADRRLARRRCR